MNIYYKLYLKQTLRLVSSLVIKSDHAIKRMNERVVLEGIGVDPGLPERWKYYMNIYGEYHQMDKLMYVTSQDTFEEIPFTKESLDDHLLTRRAYREHGRFYKSLVSEYPSQELLIRGILNPIPYSESIAARNHKILAYDKNLIEPQETFLIPELQEYIDGAYDRWYNFDYDRIEPLYSTYMDGIIYANLPMQILLSRKRRRFTELVHSYHIRMYLLSFNKKIGDEFEFLSRAQRLWLYRNIREVSLNIGKNATMELVTEKIMNLRGFPVTATTLKHDYEFLLDELVPDITTEFEPVGYVQSSIRGLSSLTDLFDRTEHKAPMNHEFRLYNEETFRRKYQNNRFDQLTTKILESNIMDDSEAQPFDLKSMLLNYWPYLAYMGYYDARASITVPTTGQNYRLNMLDAFYLYVYLITAHQGVILKELPCLYISRVLRPDPPSLSHLESLRMEYTPKSFIDYISFTTPKLQTVNTVVTFNTMIVKMNSAIRGLRATRHYQDDYRVEGNLHQMMDQYYYSRQIDPHPGMRYGDWFTLHEIDIDLWTKEDMLAVAHELYERCTGHSVDSGSALKELHSAMIRIHELLTSYSVQMLTNVNDESVKIMDTKFPKGTIPESIETHDIDADINITLIDRLKSTQSSRVRVQTTNPAIRDVDSDELSRISIPVHLPASAYASMDAEMDMQFEIPRVQVIRDDLIDIGTGVSDTVVRIDYAAVDIPNGINRSWITKYSDYNVNRMKIFLNS